MRKRNRKGLRSDEVSAEDARRTLELDYVESVLSVDQLREQLAKWQEAWSHDQPRPLRELAEVFSEPDRLAILCPQDDRNDTGVKYLLVFDKRCNELIRWAPVRSTRLLNSLSLAGVSWTTLDRSAQDWALSRLSSRRVRPGGKIQ